MHSRTSPEPLRGLAVAIFVPLFHSMAGAQAAPVSYTVAQAAAGRAAYARACAGCHGQNLDDGTFGPALKGASFLSKYGGQGGAGLFSVISTKMPPDNPGSLELSAYTEILAFVLQSNGVPPGTQELTGDTKQLTAMILPASGTPAARKNSKPQAPIPAVLQKITPVTDAVLANPPDDDWLSWRRTYDAHGFSPLKQISKKNVHDLHAAWTWSLPNGPNEATPLVHDGVIFMYSYGDKVQALDAATGDLLWQYSRQLPKDLDQGQGRLRRGIAIYGQRIYVGTSDVHMVALDEKTGSVVWDHEIADYRLRETLTSGPIVAKGKIVVGTTGTGFASVPGGPEIVGIDAATGNIAWRFHTIARPGEPGGESWNGVPLDKRTGASVWTPGSYDPALGLVFFGTGQTYDIRPLQHPIGQPGVTSDALYTDSTLALDVDTGKLAWHFQHQPNDQWDLDWAFEQQLVELPVNGKVRTAVVTSGKTAIYEAMDAESGKYLFSIDLGLQNVVSAIDPKTGAKTANPSFVPGDGTAKVVCPHAGGAKSWIPASYNAATKTLFVNLVESCMDVIPASGRGPRSMGVDMTARPREGSDGKFGRLEAINLRTREVVWKMRQRAPETSGVLDTAGGVVFAASMDRYFRAFDDATGKLLWEGPRLNDVSNSCPITYMVNGKQYVAIVVGAGGYHTSTYAPLVPELQSPPDHGAALWVFGL